jgi:hypothetical protein
MFVIVAVVGHDPEASWMTGVGVGCTGRVTLLSIVHVSVVTET